MDDTYQDFWGAFLDETSLPETTPMARATYFGAGQEEALAVMEQLLFGEKTAISHCIPYYLVTRTPMPREGDLTMVTDFYGNPCLILRTKGVIIAPVPEITGEVAAMEQQGDLTAWRNRKKQEFTALAARSSFHYNDENPVLMEIVECIYPKKEDVRIS